MTGLTNAAIARSNLEINGEVLYGNSSETSGTSTLSTSAANYTAPKK